MHNTMNKCNHITVIIIILLITFPSISTENLFTPSQKIQSFPLPKNHSAIKKAITYLKSQQSTDGSIGGLSISAWAAMAFASVNDHSDSFNNLTRYLLTSLNTLNQTDKATDWQRHILGITAGNNSIIKEKKTFFIKKIKQYYKNKQFGEENNIYDDCFGLFALASLTNNSINQQIKKNLQHTILENQQSHGGWNDVDTTAIAIMALQLTGEPVNSSHMKKAYTYLKKQQSKFGGFASWGSANTASTAWAISALTSLNSTTTSFIWNSSKPTPIEYLLSLQQLDGSFNYTPDSSLHPTWMTSYAIIALRGKTFPVTFLASNQNQTTEPDNNENEKNDNSDNTKIPTPKQLPLPSKKKERNQQYLFTISPMINGVYFNNNYLSLNTRKPIYIGSITFTIQTNASIDIVTFSLNNHQVHVDTIPPFTFTYNSKIIYPRIEITAKGFTVQKNISNQDLETKIKLLIQAKNHLHTHSYHAFLNQLNEFKRWLLPAIYKTDSYQFAYINLFKKK